MRPLHFALRFVALLVVVAPNSIAQERQILQIHEDTLTSYSQPSATPVQGVRPIAMQRGVGIDGTLRAAPSHRWALAGNPFENAWRGTLTDNGVRLDVGAYSPMDVDIALPATIPWVIARTHNAIQDDGGHIDSDGYQGVNWFQSSQPELLFDGDCDCLYIVYGADRYIEFYSAAESETLFKAKNGAAGVIELHEGESEEPDLWVWTDQHGTETTFFGFNENAEPATGQLWRITDPSWNGSTGNIAYVGHKTDPAAAIGPGFDDEGRIEVAYDSSDRRFTYVYSDDTPDSAFRLMSVTAEIKASGTWASPSGVEEVGKVAYSYYGNQTDGDIGDLKVVTKTVRLNDDGTPITQTKRKHYRYWEGSYNASTNPGYPHQVRLVLDYEGARRYDWSDTTFDQDFLGETVANLKPYSAGYFEYASDRKVRAAWSNGECGCGGASDGQHDFTYEANADYTDSSGYQQLWATRTIVDRPDGSFLTQYFDETGQPLSQVITDGDPGDGTPDKWVTQVERDANGCVEKVRTPANNSAYYHNNQISPAKDAGTIESSSSKLVHHFVRESSGDMTGFLLGRKHSDGTGTAYYDESLVWTSIELDIGDVVVVRPLVNLSRRFPTDQSTLTGYEETETTYSTYSGDDFVIETVVTEQPIVTTGNNGPGGSVGDKLARHFRKDGLVDFERLYLDPETSDSSADRIINYTEYTNGLVTKTIQDADTDIGGDVLVAAPSTLFESLDGSTKLHKKSTTTYTKAGQRFAVTMPGTQGIHTSYTSRLADHRLVRLEYPEYYSSEWYGPVSYSVQNQAGKPEAQGVIDLGADNKSSEGQANHIDESSDDPITAIDTGSSFGSLARLSTSHYNESGAELEQQRAYFLISASEPGVDGTNYDATIFAYDDMGRRIRTEEPSGTIRRTVHDILGRSTESWIGTDDTGLPGSPMAGSSNIVKTDSSVYDLGSDDGNSLVTRRTAFVQDNSTGSRETNYTNDYRGRVILETAPEMPYAHHKYDNMGRRVATGLYISTSGLSASTSPLSETTNRRALNEMLYDERGRAWKHVRHKISQANGASGDTLESLSWFDRLGRMIKQDGESLTKTVYDRIGRMTDEFALAKVDDASPGWADAQTLTGDFVLEQHQTRYDPSTNVVLCRATIERLYSDKDASTGAPLYGGTTGALDTNADANALTLTMSTTEGSSNVKGRPRITAYWYDRVERENIRVEYGTYELTTFVHPVIAVTSPPTTSVETPRWETTYSGDGSVAALLDPRANETRYDYDDLGRRTAEIRNYDDNDPSTGTDDDVTIRYEYVDGLRTEYTADVPGTDQTTLYTYGTTKGASAGDSKIATGHLLQKVTYPDSEDADDVVKHAYDAQGAEIWKMDQAGNVIESTYDPSGRQTGRTVTTLAGGFDDAILFVETGYDGLGRVDAVRQWNEPEGDVLDEVAYSYDDWGNLTLFKQDPDSAIGAEVGRDDVTIGYTWVKPSNSGRNTLRRDTMTMPYGDPINYKYRGTPFLDAASSRVSYLERDGGATVVTYSYNGVGTVVATDYPEPDVMSRQHDAAWNSFPDLDLHGRVVASKWTKDLGSDVDFYHVELAYDANGNVLRAADAVHPGFDVLYQVDAIDRLTDAEEGTLEEVDPGEYEIADRTRQQTWTLDHVGNWSGHQLNLNGDMDCADTDEVDECRIHNDVNELVGHDADCNDDVDGDDLTYDPAGNLKDDREDYEYVWDAFYRLREVRRTDNQDLVAEYRYNGLGYRIAVHEDVDTDSDVDGDDPWWYDVFDERWRQVARWRGDDADPREEYVYHAAGAGGFGGSSYIDLVACRDRDADVTWDEVGDGELEERVYYCQNQHADVSAIVGSEGVVKEWAKYSAYGVPFGLPCGDADSDGGCDDADEDIVKAWI